MNPRAQRQTDPIRNPEGASARTRSKRALFLLLLTVFIPGGAQVVAGNRSLGRKALAVTLACWFAILLVIAVGVVNRGLVIQILARPQAQLVLAFALVLLAVGWLILFVNTLRIIRPGLLSPGMKGIIAAVTAVLVVATSGALGYGAYVLNTGRGTIENVFTAGPAFDPVDGRYNILLMGGDAGANRVGLRPDSISLVSIDAKTGQTAVISVPRNFQNAQFPASSPMGEVFPDGFDCGDECIINALYPTVENDYADLYPGAANPGAEAMMDAIEGSTGVEVQAYVLIDMAGFEEFIDAMGGVTLDSGGWVPYRGPQRSDSPIRTRWFPPGEINLSGADALWYARSRYFTTDYHRIRRQQCMQQAMISQFNPQTVLTRFSGIMSAGERLLETDIPQDQLGSFINLADKSRKSPTARLTLGAPDFGTSSDRFSTFPDFGQIHTRVDELLLEASADAPEPSSAAPATGSGGSDSGASDSPAKSPDRESADAASTAVATAASTAAPAKSSSSETIESGAGDDVPTTQPDGSPITEEYLIQLELNGQTDLLSRIASNNNECSAP